MHRKVTKEIFSLKKCTKIGDSNKKRMLCDVLLHPASFF